MPCQGVLCLISVFHFSIFFFLFLFVFTECWQHPALLILGTHHFEPASAQCFIFSSRTYWPSDTNKRSPNIWIYFWESVLRDGAPRITFTGFIKNQYGFFLFFPWSHTKLKIAVALGWLDIWHPQIKLYPLIKLCPLPHTRVNIPSCLAGFLFYLCHISEDLFL